MITTLGLSTGAQSEPELVRLSEAQLRPGFRTWNGNDEKGRKTHHGVFKLQDSPKDLKLTWCESDISPVMPVGCYRLNLPALLKQGYVRMEPRTPGAVRLRFVHSRDAIYIQVRSNAPSLHVATLKETL